MNVHNRSTDAVSRQQFGSLQRLGNHQAGGNQAYIGAVLHDVGLAGDEGSIFFGNHVAHRARYADINRAVDLCRSKDSLLGFNRITGNKNGHVRNNAHQRQVLNGLVAAAVLTDTQAGMREAEFHVGVYIRNSIANLFVCASGAEQRKGAGKGDQTGMRKARCRTDEVCLRNTEVEKAVRVCIHEHAAHGSVGQVGVHRDYLIVLRAKLYQSLAVCYS